MRKFPFLFSLLALFSFTSFAQNKDAIVGKWWDPSKEGQIEIYKRGDKYFGKLAWMKDPNVNGKPKLDSKNPNERLRSRSMLNLEILKNFEYNSGKWTSGTIYDPQSGKNYSCILSLKSADVLNLRGYVGFSLLGRTEVFTRVK